jgi:hypothetical protein
MELHNTVCKKCKKCGRCYTNTHTDDECRKNMINLQTFKTKSIGPKVKAKSFKAVKNIIYADFETLINKVKSLTPYATAYAIDDGETIIYKGQNSLDLFMTDLLKLNKDIKYTLVFYNGSRFDLYFVYKWLLNNKEKLKKHISDLIYADGAFKKLSFNNITTFDLNLHLDGKLKNNCKAFGVDTTKSKGDFNHKLIKDWVDVDKYENDTDTNNGWRPYLKLDIISMRELYIKYADSIWTSFFMNVNEYMTLSSMAYDLWRTTLTKPLKKLPYGVDKWVRRSIYGGRCYPQKQYFVSKQYQQIINKSIEYDLINDCLYDADKVSLYPTAMGKSDEKQEFLPNFNLALFPYGDFKEYTNEKDLTYYKEQLNKGNSIGYKFFILEADIIPNKSLVSSVLPHRDEKGNLLWDLHNIKNGVYNSVDMKRALLHGYKIDKIHKILIFNDNYGYIFKEYINMVFEMKKKAVKDTPQYSVAKLLMNSLYGKMLQVKKLVLFLNQKNYIN